MHLSISNDIVSTKIYDIRDDLDFEIVNFPLGIGESTITNKQIKSKTSNRNDKYFYSDYLEYFEGHLENYGELMKSRYFEFMEEDLTYKSSSLLGIKGSLKRHITYWENIGASAFILDIISSGYKIPFYLTPESSFSNNNRSAIEHSDFVRDSIEDLIANGFAIKAPFKPACVNPLTVSINKQGKKRLILDLRILNKLIWKQRVKFEDWKYAMNYFEKGSISGVYISQLIRFARASSYVAEFNTRNKLLTQKLLKQGYRYHKLRKTFSKFYRRYYDLISKFQVGLKSLFRQGLSEPDFYGDLVYKLKKIVGSNNFSAQFIKIISHYKKIGYNINVLQQTACLVVNPITVGNFAFLFNCTPVGRTSDSMMVPT